MVVLTCVGALQILKEDNKMRFEIKHAKNGYIVYCDSDEEPLVFQEVSEELEEVEAWACFLRELTFLYGPDMCRSRYSAKRIYVDVRPGDKHEPSGDES
jgi:hypothetical protein